MSKGALQPCDPVDPAPGVCCPPIVGLTSVADPDGAPFVFPDGFVDLGVFGLPDPVVLQFGSLKMDGAPEGGSAEVRRYPLPLPPGVPAPFVVAGTLAVVPGGAGVLDRLRVTVGGLAGLPGGGEWELVFTNACGCCTSYNLKIGAN